MLDKGSLPGQGQDPKLLETHISWVLLSGSYAIKIKRPVHFSFLDFSTIEARKKYLDEELRLNRRLAPSIYLEILPIWKLPSGTFVIQKEAPIEGHLEDHCLLMQRLDSHRQMDVLLNNGQVTPTQIQQLAEAMAKFHQKAIPIFQGNQAQRQYDLYQDLAGVIPKIRSFAGQEVGQALDKSIPFVKEFLDRRADRLAEREAKGWVIDGHGDLHAGNIFLLEEPVIFDCIEFNPEMRHLDILSELGFFLMDLDYHEYSQLGQLFLTTYQAHLPVIETKADEELLLYFKMYRANVRLKVGALRWESSKANPSLTEQLLRFSTLLITYLNRLKEEAN